MAPKRYQPILKFIVQFYFSQTWPIVMVQSSITKSHASNLPLQHTCKFRVVLCKLTSQYGAAGLDMPLRESSNHVYQLTITYGLYQTVI